MAFTIASKNSRPQMVRVTIASAPAARANACALVPAAARKRKPKLPHAKAQTQSRGPRLPRQRSARGCLATACAARARAERPRNRCCTRRACRPPRTDTVFTAPIDCGQPIAIVEVAKNRFLVRQRDAEALHPEAARRLPRKSRRSRTRNGRYTASILRAWNPAFCSCGESEWPIGSPITP